MSAGLVSSHKLGQAMLLGDLSVAFCLIVVRVGLETIFQWRGRGAAMGVFLSPCLSFCPGFKVSFLTRRQLPSILGEFFMRWKKLLFSRHSYFMGMFMLLISATVGCGGKGTVTGKVTIDGNPLPVGRIAFIPSKGVAASADIKDGQYTVTGIPPGATKVTVETKSIQEKISSLDMPLQNEAMVRLAPGSKIPDNAKAELEEQKKKDEERIQSLKELKAKYRPIPDKYSLPDTSGLTFTVKSGSNTFDVPLTSK